MGGMWQHGPAFCKSPIFILVTLVHSAMVLTAAAIVWTGPIHVYMFSSRMITFLVFAVATFFQLLASALAPASSAIPEKPHTSLATPVFYAADITMRFMNAFTDLSFVRIVLDQVLGFSLTVSFVINGSIPSWQCGPHCISLNFCLHSWPPQPTFMLSLLTT